MILPEYVAPALAAGSPAVLVFIAVRFGGRSLDAISRLLLVFRIALVGRDDDKRRQRCVEALRALCRDQSPPLRK
jgi:hypothetical protein